MTEKTDKMKNLMESRIDRGIEYRNMSLSIVEDDAEDSYHVRGYATTFNAPYTLYSDGEYRVDEVVDPHAFDNCDMSDVIMQYDHTGRVFARTRNQTLSLEPDGHGLLTDGYLGGTDIGHQLFQEIKGGYTDRMSFSFIVDGAECTERIENGVIIVTRRITSISKLFDVSAVSIPANDGTEISARSLCDGILAEVDAERRRIEARRKLELKLKLMEV